MVKVVERCGHAHGWSIRFANVRLVSRHPPRYAFNYETRKSSAPPNKMTYIIGFIVFILLCFLAAKLAEDRGQSGLFAFFLSLVLSPLVGLLVVFLRENRAKTPQVSSVGARVFTPADYDRVPKPRRNPVEVAKGGATLGKLV